MNNLLEVNRDIREIQDPSLSKTSIVLNKILKGQEST